MAKELSPEQQREANFLRSRSSDAASRGDWAQAERYGDELRAFLAECFAPPSPPYRPGSDGVVLNPHWPAVSARRLGE